MKFWLLVTLSYDQKNPDIFNTKSFKVDKQNTKSKKRKTLITNRSISFSFDL